MQRNQSSSSLPPLLISRAEAARLLGGVSIATLIRLEAKGKLRPRKLSGPSGRTFYWHSDLLALAGERQTFRSRGEGNK